MQRQSISWLLLEGSAIVASILIAFAIDASWERVQEDALEQRLLKSLRSEIKPNLVNIEGAAKNNAAVIKSSDRLFALAVAANDTRDLTEVDSLLANLGWYFSAAFSTGAIDAVISSGNLDIIKDSSLRTKIAALAAFYEIVSKMEHTQYEVLMGTYWPYIIRNGYLPQIHSVGIANELPGGADFYKKLPAYQLIEPPTDHTVLLDDKSFLGVILMKRSVHNDALSGYEIIIPMLQEIFGLIDTSLDDPT